MSTSVNYGGVFTEILMQPSELEIVTDAVKALPENGLMVEWGSGGSTCRWLETLKPSQRLISIEHNENWFNRVNRAVKNEFGNVSNFEFFHKPELHGFEHGYASILEEHPVGTEEYLNPSDSIWDADLYFIDGIARATCAMTVLLKHRKTNPVVYLHDYVGREIWYEWALQNFKLTTFTDVDVKNTLVRLEFKN